MRHLNDLIETIDALQERIGRQRPLTETERHQLREYYRIGLTYATNALEGNTLTESETKVVLEDGITIGGKPLRYHYHITLDPLDTLSPCLYCRHDSR